jgi:hypothetical protein
MRRFALVICSSLGLLTGLTASPVHAQFIPGGAANPRNRPAFSPWLNLNRTDAPVATNYYGLVRPEFNALNSFQQLYQQQGDIASQQTSLEQSLTLPATGHASGYMNYRKYFMTKGGAAPAAQFGAAPAGAAAASKSARR